MRRYIEDLTNNLIGAYNFDRIGERIKNREDFLNHVTRSLEAGAVKDMKPETLGKIMCSFEIGDIVASKHELLEGVCFAGDCEEMQRDLVARCLAYVIRDRLDSPKMPHMPAYRTRSVTSFRSETSSSDGRNSVRSGRSEVSTGPRA